MFLQPWSSSRPRKIRGFCGSATERSQSAPRTSPEHPSDENTVFYDGFNASECKNIVFYVFLSVLGASPGRPQSIPAVKTPYFTMVFMPLHTKTPYFTCFCASPERPQGVSRASQNSKHVFHMLLRAPECPHSVSRVSNPSNFVKAFVWILWLRIKTFEELNYDD